MRVLTWQHLRRRIDDLWKQPVLKADNPLSGLDEISDKDLEQYDIRRVPFNFGALDQPETYFYSNPPILFRPCPVSVLRQYPLDLEDDLYKETTEEYREYNPHSTNKEPYDTIDWVWEGFTFLEHWALGSFRRIGLPVPRMINLREVRKLKPISLPNPFLLHGSMYETRLGHDKGWSSKIMLESKKEDEARVYPHVTLVTVLRCNGNEDSMLIGELASIIAAMKNRAYQPEISKEEEGEEVFDLLRFDKEEMRRRRPAFKNEHRFPVLMVSLLGPQHGRLSYACMDGETLVIRQSVIYSFEKLADAPWDFFSRMILSAPLTEDSVHPIVTNRTRVTPDAGL